MSSNIPQSGTHWVFRNPHSFLVEWEPRFVEEAVLRAVGARGARGLHGERDRLYEIREPEEREAAFRDFHAAWFERLDLDDVIWRALQEQPLIGFGTRACLVAHARGRRDQGAELFVSPGGEGTERERRWVVIRLDPQRVLDGDSLLPFLRHELLHIADMLDPVFGYEPRLPRAELGPAHERLLQDRYRVLWDTYIDGRLCRHGRATVLARDGRLQEFARTFPMLGDGAGETFTRFFDGTCLTHANLVTFAVNPANVSGSAPFNRFPDSPVLQVGPRAGQRCPLCGFPTHSFAGNPDRLPAEIVDRIQADFPTWSPSRGLCRQCSDLYHSRARLLTPAS